VPTLKAATVKSVQVRMSGQRETRAELTNGGWRLTQPVRYPAQAAKVEALLKALEQLTFATYIPEQELRKNPKAEEEFGVEPAQSFLVFEEQNYRRQIHIGHRTPPGDQVYVQVVGIGGVYVVDAEWLKLLPVSSNDWRENSLLNLAHLNFNHLYVTNAGNVLELQRDPTNKLWRMVMPIKARADHDKVETALQQLQNLQVQRFVSDDAGELETYGLAPPELSIALLQDTNILMVFGFGKTNAGIVFAHRYDLNSVVAVTNSPLAPWRAPHETFRNPHLFTLTSPINAVEVHAQDVFTLQQQASNSWRIEPQGLPADAMLANELLGNLSGMRVTEFVKDSVPDVELGRYGLATPAREYILKQTITNSAGQLTNVVLADLQFGTNQEDKVFARLVGESYVYAVREADLEELPSLSWQMRERRLWNFSEDAVTNITVNHDGKTRIILHSGTNEWSLASGSQGFINVGGVEESAHLLGQLSAVAWVARGEQNRESFGFSTNGLQITVQLKSGEKFNVEFGREASPGIPYASVTLDHEPWIFAFPPMLYQFVRLYLLIPNQP
jgi:hypothetical protein